MPRPEVAGLSEYDILSATQIPARYGFHATLKPPFRLRHDKSLELLTYRMARFAAGAPAFQITGLRLTRLGRFLALVPPGPERRIEDLAARCVWEFDEFRRPPSDQELSRRRAGRLSSRQEELLLKWGYPYVLDEFRFHLTLTGPLEETDLERIEKGLNAVSQSIGGPVTVTDIALFGDPGNGESFRLLLRFPLAQPSTPFNPGSDD